jgi:hypothetical protein
VQLFDTAESLAATVSCFLHDGYRAGGTLLLIARAAHRQAIVDELSRRGCSAANAAAERRVIALDAHETLARMSAGRRVDAGLFGWTVGSMVRRLASVGALRIYSEVVEVLASHRDFDEALRLEMLWNNLAARHRFTLMCGYSSAHFTPDDAQPVLAHICGCHNEAKARTDDPLGRWLLRTAARVTLP